MSHHTNVDLEVWPNSRVSREVSGSTPINKRLDIDILSSRKKKILYSNVKSSVNRANSKNLSSIFRAKSE